MASAPSTSSFLSSSLSTQPPSCLSPPSLLATSRFPPTSIALPRPQPLVPSVSSFPPSVSWSPAFASPIRFPPASLSRSPTASASALPPSSAALLAPAASLPPRLRCPHSWRSCWSYCAISFASSSLWPPLYSPPPRGALRAAALQSYQRNHTPPRTGSWCVCLPRFGSLGRYWVESRPPCFARTALFSDFWPRTQGFYCCHR